jgi:DNA modification methylase
MGTKGQYQFIHGDSSNMDVLRSGEVDLVFTGPPYFSDQTQELLAAPLKEQRHLERVRSEVTEYALSLRPVYEEIRRVLRRGGYLVTQTKDLCYGGFFISLTAIHVQMIEATGLNLLNHVYWHKFKRRSDPKRFLDNPLVGMCRNDFVEDICVFSDLPWDCKKHGPVELTDEEIAKSVNPLWVIGPASKQRIHPHQAPKALARRIIGLYTEPGDLVVDPFCGSGNTLKVAVEMGRRAVGYEIKEKYAEAASRSLLETVSSKGGVL